jgi:oligoribonuclease NrnB/cAMP/cGMP phosphodiesterase (DHH superfamily)
MHSGPWTGYDHLKKHNFVDRKVTEPYAVRLAGEYDIWDKRDPNADTFQHGLRSQDLTPDVWKALLDDGIMDATKDTGMCVSPSEVMSMCLVNKGAAIQYAKIHENKSIIKSAGFDLDWEGLHFLAVNHARYNSLLFTAGLKPEHDACYGFAWKNGQWTVSLYHAPGKEHHDLSKIAVKYGGGGHKGACGFQTKTLPFFQ